MKVKHLLMALSFVVIFASVVFSESVSMVKLNGGSFERVDNNGVTQHVSVGPFLIAKEPITVKGWIEYLKATHQDVESWESEAISSATGGIYQMRLDPNWPVFFVSWGDAIQYCNWLSRKSGLEPVYKVAIDTHSHRTVTATWNVAADGYRLPTEAEWEFASGISSSVLTARELLRLGWFRENSGGRPHEVGKKPKNKWGIYDMFGDVSEFCWDLYSESYYSESIPKNPVGPQSFFASDAENPADEIRVIRGGAWMDSAHDIAAEPRYYYTDYYAGSVGFRLARNAQN